MPPKAKATWSVDPKSVVVKVDATGTFTLSCTILDAGVKVLTPTLTIDADRACRLLVHGESAATTLTGFEAWSDF